MAAPFRAAAGSGRSFGGDAAGAEGVAVRPGAEGMTLMHAATEVALEQPDEQEGPEPADQSARPQRYRGIASKC